MPFPPIKVQSFPLMPICGSTELARVCDGYLESELEQKSSASVLEPNSDKMRKQSQMIQGWKFALSLVVAMAQSSFSRDV